MARDDPAGGNHRLQLLLILVTALVFVAAAAGARNPPPVVVVGDVQGATKTVIALLRSLALIDDSGSWSGGDTVLVQTGDLIDGGESSRAAMDLFMRLQEEAPAAGGRVIVLMGDHEAMNILGHRGFEYRSPHLHE